MKTHLSMYHKRARKINQSLIDICSLNYMTEKKKFLPSFGPDIRAAPLSEVKKTKVSFSMPSVRSHDKIWPTL